MQILGVNNQFCRQNLKCVDLILKIFQVHYNSCSEQAQVYEEENQEITAKDSKSEIF